MNLKKDTIFIDNIKVDAIRTGQESDLRVICFDSSSVKASESLSAGYIYIMDVKSFCSDSYPSIMTEAIKVWWYFLNEERINPDKTVFAGCSYSARNLLSVCLYCRDHGIPLPSSIVLEDPVLRGGESDVYSMADYDDPCAFPLIADFFLFPPVTILITDKSTGSDDCSALCQCLEEQKIRFFQKKI